MHVLLTWQLNAPPMAAALQARAASALRRKGKLWEQRPLEHSTKALSEDKLLPIFQLQARAQEERERRGGGRWE